MKIVLLCVLLGACAVNNGGNGSEESEGVVAELGAAHDCAYPQIFGNASHTGMPCPDLHGMQVVAALPQDEDAEAITADFGFLSLHEPPPLTHGDWLIVPGHHGYAADPFDRSADRWRITAYQWLPSVHDPRAHLEQRWVFESDWQPVDAIKSIGYVTNGYVQQFSPVVFGGAVYAPAASGRVAKIDLDSGVLREVIDPLAGTPFSGDARVTVNSALSFGPHSIFYTAVAWPITPVPSISEQPRNAWLVEINRQGRTKIAPWAQIASSSVGIPAGTDLCEYPFGTSGTPAATGPTSQPPRFGCGVQRPSLNAAVAVDPYNGHLIVLSHANNALGATFMVEVNQHTLQPIAAFDTRGHAFHGCGVRLDADFVSDAGNGCAVLAGRVGVDPDFNGAVRFRGNGLMKNAITVAPGGNISIGGYDGGFVFGGEYDARGFGMVFRRDGALQALNTTHWWDITPSVWPHGHTFSYLQDRQLYSEGELHAARLSPTMEVEAQGNLNGAPSDTSDFRDANIVFGPEGTYYAFSGDGNLYKYGADGETLESIALPDDTGAPNTLVTLAGNFARDRVGRIYTSQGGKVYVIASGLGTGGGQAVMAGARAVQPRGSLAARQAAIQGARMPEPPSR